MCKAFTWHPGKIAVISRVWGHTKTFDASGVAAIVGLAFLFICCFASCFIFSISQQPQRKEVHEGSTFVNIGFHPTLLPNISDSTHGNHTLPKQINIIILIWSIDDDDFSVHFITLYLERLEGRLVARSASNKTMVNDLPQCFPQSWWPLRQWQSTSRTLLSVHADSRGDRDRKLVS